jgi:hypothetical protein
MFNAQLKTLRYHFTNFLGGLNLNIPDSMREYFRLTDFRAPVYNVKVKGGQNRLSSEEK